MADVNWDLLAQSDPSYVPQHGANKNSILQLIRQFGQSSALSAPVRAQYGITDADLSGVDKNPYSTLSNLAKTLQQNQYGITNNAAAHGAEFSGAHAAQRLQEGAAGDQRNWDALQGLNTGIQGIGSTDAGQYATAIQNLMANYQPPAPPAPAPIAAPAPVAAPPAAGPALNGLGTPYIDPGARESLVQPPKLKIPKPPKIVGIHAQ